MSLSTCKNCGSFISGAAPTCRQCGRPRSAPEVRATDPLVQQDIQKAAVEASDSVVDPMPFHPLDITKFVLLSVGTFGLYDLYWFYRNWKLLKDQFRQDLSPFWRAFFAPLWGFSLFGEIHAYAGRHGRHVGWSAGLVGALYLIWVALWRLPDPWWLVSLFSFIPLIPVQHTINDVAVRRGLVPNRAYSGKHILVMVLGGIFTLLAVIGTFMPVE